MTRGHNRQGGPIVSDWSALQLPLIIFAAEVCVVTISTLRIIAIARGQTLIAPVLGFFEVTTWLFAIGQVMQNLDNFNCGLGFALGFTLGNFLGIQIEKLLALGTVIVRVITHRDASELIEHLRAANFGVTCTDGQGATGAVQIVLTIVKRKQLGDVVAMIEAHHPQAFYAVDEVQSAAAGIFPAHPRRRVSVLPTALRSLFSAS
jgi:uncharacterized protein YebE (UPF0316 family)